MRACHYSYNEKMLMNVFVVPKGSVITFTTETFGLGFFVGQRKVCLIPMFDVGQLANYLQEGGA